MICNSWQEKERKVYFRRGACLVPTPKNFEQRGEVFAAGVWGIQHSTRRKRWSGFSQISRNISGLLEKGKFSCHIQFQTDFLVAQTDLLCKNTQVTYILSTGILSKVNCFLKVVIALHCFLGSILYFNQALFPGEMCFPIFFHLLEKCF